MQQVLKDTALAVPFLSIILGVLNGQFGLFGPSIQSVSAAQNQVYPIIIQPADYAFSIWGPIYLGLLALAALQAFVPGSRNRRYRQARLPLTVNMVINFFWFIATQNESNLSAVLLLAQFLTAVWLYYALALPSAKVWGLERLVRVSVRLYVGWLTVATVVTGAYLLGRAGWSGWGVSDTSWTVIMLLVASAIGLFARFAWRDAVYGAVFVWAFVGIAVKEGQPLVVVVTASILALLFLTTLFPAVGRAVRLGRLAPA